jgi:type IV pilus assembly protein PilB
MSLQLAELLQKDKIITSAQLQESVGAARDHGKEHVRFLIDQKYVSETKLLYYLSQKFGLASVNIAKFDIASEVAKILTSDQAFKYQAIPIQSNPTTVVLAVCDPTKVAQIEDLKFQVKRAVEVVLTTFSAFDGAMEKHFGSNHAVGNAIAQYEKSQKKSTAAEQAEAGPVLALEMNQIHEIDPGKGPNIDAPVIALVNGILSEAVRRKASDIHCEPYEKRFRVRMRVDGVLYETAQIPVEMKRAVIARLKVMARLDISESRIPQDGRMKLKFGNQEIDFRVNSMPTIFGEKVVLRQLNKSNVNLKLDALGFETEQMKTFKKGIYSPTGMVLVTGPTGSGKTTTLYSALMELNQISDNVSTAEDPVEYNLEGINQVQVNKDVGLTFPAVLRALLRQDPDVILVGEVRDYETAEVAIQAALTGHLVLSTLHTNDAPSTIVRLTNMGIEPFLVVASLNTIVAQRLLRRLCTECAVDRVLPKEKIAEFGFDPARADKLKFREPRGCSQCNNTGYRGRMAIYEVMEFSQALKEMVLRGDSVLDLKRRAVKDGMQTLRVSALSKAAAGLTSVEEALTLTMEN